MIYSDILTECSKKEKKKEKKEWKKIIKERKPGPAKKK